MKSSFFDKLVLVLLIVIFSNSCKKEEVPTLTTSAITNISGTSVISGGTITSEGSETVIARGVCWSTGTTPTTADSKTSDGAGAGSFTSSISGLNGATNYYVRAYATNSVGTGYGMAMSFTTLGQAPTPTVSVATNVNVTSSTLNGSVNANYLSTVVTFEYGTTTSYGTSVTAIQSPVTGNTNTNVSADITGLTAGTTYHYRVKAINSLGTSYGGDITFITLGQVPTATTQAATNIDTISVKLNGLVNANDLSTTVTFEYGTTTDYGSSVTASQSPVTGHTNTAVSAALTELNPGTIYHYRVKSVNSLGIVYGNDFTFTTLGQGPTVNTIAATTINFVDATLNGIVNANYLASTITFEYGLTTSYGQSATASQSPITGNIMTNVNIAIKGLAIGTTYHFRVKAVNSLGTAYGNDMTFTTPKTVNDIDGNVYNVVAIGTQVWMKENLKTTKFNDNSAIPLLTDNSAWMNSTTMIGGYCWYDNNEVLYKEIYGALYNHYAVNSGKLCPTGWHVPWNKTGALDWAVLANYLGGFQVAGGKLKETGTVHWNSPNTAATNETGFTALPGGARYVDGTFFDIERAGSWWGSNSYPISILDNSGEIITWELIWTLDEDNGLSVRCIKD